MADKYGWQDIKADWSGLPEGGYLTEDVDDVTLDLHLAPPLARDGGERFQVLTLSGWSSDNNGVYFAAADVLAHWRRIRRALRAERAAELGTEGYRTARATLDGLLDARGRRG